MVQWVIVYDAQCGGEEPPNVKQNLGLLHLLHICAATSVNGSGLLHAYYMGHCVCTIFGIEVIGIQMVSVPTHFWHCDIPPICSLSSGCCFSSWDNDDVHLLTS